MLDEENNNEQELEEGETTEVAEGAEQEAEKPRSKKKIMIIAGALLLVLSFAGSFYYWRYLGGNENEVVSEGLNEPEPPKTREEQVEEISKMVYLLLPEMIVNLRTTPHGRASLLKCVLVLEISSEDDSKVVEALRPKILDSFQSHIRELTLDQIEGAAGMERLRKDLTDKANAITTPVVVQKILVKEFLTQ